MVLNLNAHWFPWISNILLVTAHFIMKMNIDDVLCHKTITEGAKCSGAQCHQINGAPNRSARGCSKKNLIAKKCGSLGNPKLHSPAFDIREATFYMCIIDRRKSFFCLKWNYSVKSMQTFLYVLLSSSFKTFYKNLHNFWTHNNFYMKFSNLVSKLLIYKLANLK